jgi:Holliday junction resolvase RusA-like endonuclease
MTSITFEVLGTPAPKGSGRAMMIGGKARHIASGSTANQTALKAWDVAVRDTSKSAMDSLTGFPMLIATPLRLTVVFRMRRPAGHYHRGKDGAVGNVRASAPRFPATKPDLSKLIRATEDSMIGIVYDDDSRIVHYGDTRKEYAVNGNEGATITVEAL